MRFLLLIALVISPSSTLAQSNLWNKVSPQASVPLLQPASPSESHLKSFAHLLRQQKPEEPWDCDAAGIDDLIKGLQFESIPIAPRQNVVLAEAPAGCARGGQGANGAMWLIRFDQDTPVLLANPKEFSGWLYSVQPSSDQGYSDIVLGWHMAAGLTGSGYFRFDGKFYHNIGTAILHDDGYQKNSEIVPNSK